MSLKSLVRLCLNIVGLSLATVLAAQAQPITQVTQFGTVDPGCINEGATCAADPAFTPSFGGYRAGGSVSWTFSFDPSPFSSISSIQLDVLAVGFLYNGNIGAGQIGNYLAIDGVPFAAFTGVTDGRDLMTFALPTNLAPGPHTFSVVAYGFPPGPLNEGWAGVDFATLTVVGQGRTVAVPAVSAGGLLALALLLGGSGLILRHRRT